MRGPLRNHFWTPPIGLLYLGAALRQTGRAVRLFDSCLARWDLRQTAARIAAAAPAYVAFSAFNTDADDTHALALELRRAGVSSPFIVGGPYAGSFQERILDDRNIDLVLAGEGEEALPALLDTLENQGDLAAVPNLIYRAGDDGAVRSNPIRQLADLDRLPFPDYSLLEIHPPTAIPPRMTAIARLLPSKRVMPLFTSRGCSFDCQFCLHHLGYGGRRRVLSSIHAEIDDYRDRYRAELIEICDSQLGNADRLIELFTSLRDRRDGLLYSLSVGIREHVVTRDIIGLMADAGMVHVNFSLESSSPRVQKSMRKHINIEHLDELLRECNRRRIMTNVYAILGYVDETESEIQGTVRTLCRLPADIGLFFNPVPFPGTPFGDLVRDRGIDVFGLSKLSQFFGVDGIAALPLRRLILLRKRAYRRFYFNGRRLWRILCKARLRSLDWRQFLVPLRFMFSKKADSAL